MTRHTKGWTLAWAIIDIVLAIGMLIAGIISGIPYVIVIYSGLALTFVISSIKQFIIYKEKEYLTLQEKYEEIMKGE